VSLRNVRGMSERSVRGWEIVAKEVLPDQVHSFVRVGPTDSLLAVVPAFKGRTARVLRAEFLNLGDRAKVLWTPSYFAASVTFRPIRCPGLRWIPGTRRMAAKTADTQHRNRVTRADFVCQQCAHRAQADQMAARNILRAGLALHAQAA
jgi:hypothetical protein